MSIGATITTGDPTTVPEELRFLVVEDDANTGRALRRFLARYGEAHVCSSVAEAETAATQRHFDGLLLDIELPDGSGLELLARRRAAGMWTPTLVLTGLQDDLLLQQAQLYHAQFLRKPAGGANLAAFAAWVAQWKRLTTKPLVEAVREVSRRYRLSPRQTEILLLSARGAHRGEVAQQLSVEENTIKTQVRRLLKKTGHPTLRSLVGSLKQDIERRRSAALSPPS